MRMTRAVLAERGRRLLEVSSEVHGQAENLHSAVRDYEGCPRAAEVVEKLQGMERKAKYFLALACQLRKEVGAFAAERTNSTVGGFPPGGTRGEIVRSAAPSP